MDEEKLREKTIFRKAKVVNYTQIGNDLLRTENLSWKEKGLLSLILSFPDNYRISARKLQRFSSDGIDSTRSGFRSLLKKRYLAYRKSKDSKGHFIHVYLVFEAPYTNCPCMEHPVLETPGINNNINNNKTSIIDDKSSLMAGTGVPDQVPSENCKESFEEKFGKYLCKILRIRSKHGPSKSITYTKQLRDMLVKDNISQKEIVRVMKWFIKHRSEKYTPKLYKASELRERYPRIKDAMKRYLEDKEERDEELSMDVNDPGCKIIPDKDDPSRGILR